MAEDRFTVPEHLAEWVPEANMRATVEAIFEAMGMSPEAAQQGADTLLYAGSKGFLDRMSR